MTDIAFELREVRAVKSTVHAAGTVSVDVFPGIYLFICPQTVRREETSV